MFHWAPLKWTITINKKSTKILSLDKKIFFHFFPQPYHTLAAEYGIAGPKPVIWDVNRLSWIQYVACFNQIYSLLIWWAEDKIGLVWGDPVIASDRQTMMNSWSFFAFIGLWQRSTDFQTAFSSLNLLRFIVDYGICICKWSRLQNRKTALVCLGER